MTEWKRVIKLGGFRWGLQYWRRPVVHQHSATILLFGRALLLKWEWI
jgi:hypothetical protein